MKGVQELSEKAKQRLLDSRENLQFTIDCIDAVLLQDISQTDMAKKLGIPPQSLRHRLVNTFTNDIKSVPFGDFTIRYMVEKLETPSERILHTILEPRTSGYIAFPAYDEDFFWNEYIQNLKDPRATDMLKLRHGSPDDDTVHTYAEIGAMYGITKSRVGQIIHGAYRQLRHPSRLCKLFPCYEDEIRDIVMDCTYLETKAAKNFAKLQEIKTKHKHLTHVNECIDRCFLELEIQLDDDPKPYPFNIPNENTPIEELEPALSMRPYNCLKRNGIKTLGDLAKITHTSQLQAFRNMGKKSTKEVVQLMKHHGLTIEED